MTSRARRFIPIAVLLLALAVRLILLLQTRNLAFYYTPILDSGFFHHWANFKRQVAWLDPVSTFREPVYAYFVGVLYSIFRERLTIVRLVQCILGSVTVLLLYSTARRIYGQLAAVVAGVVFALYGTAIFFASEINETTLTVFFLVASAYTLARAHETRPYLNSWLSGLLAGAAFLTRFTSIVALPAWVLHLAVSREIKLKKAILLLLVGFAIAPLCYQASLLQTNRRAFFPLRSSWHAFLGSGTTGGTVQKTVTEISLGGDEVAYKATAASGWIEGQRDFLRFAKIEDGTVENEVDAHRHWGRRVMEDFASDPVRFLKTYLLKLGLFWGPSEPPANLDVRFVARYSFLLKTRVFSFAVVACIGLLGLIVGTRRTSVNMTIFIAGFSLLASCYLISDAEKMLVVPFLSLFAGYVAATVMKSLKELRVTRAIAYIVLAAILGLVLQQLPKQEMDEARNLVIAGDVYREVGIFEKAEASYEEAITLSPGKADAYISMTRLHANTGRPEMGIEILNRGLASADDPRLRIEKADLLLMAGLQDEALAELRGLERSHPYEPRLHQLIGRCLLGKGEIEAAVEEVQKEIDYVGPGYITLSVLGDAKYRQGEYVEAARHLEDAMGYNPYSVPTATQLADAYSNLGQYLKACDVIGRILSVDPGNMPMRHKLAVCLYRAERPADALMHFKELSKFDPGNADIVLNMGTVYAEMDSIDRAIEMWERALVLDPDNRMAKDNLETAREDIRGSVNE